MRNSSRARMVGAALLGLTFVAGVAAGIMMNRLLAPPVAMKTRMVRDASALLDELRLTPDQRLEAEAILNRRGPSAEAAMREVAERLRAASDSADRELQAILSPAQRIRLDSLKRSPVFVLKRKTSRKTTVDTLFPSTRDSIGQNDATRR